MDYSETESAQSTNTIIILFVVFAILIVALVILYKKLNRYTDGEYTVRRIVYREGGLRDRARSAALDVGARLGVQLWPGGGSPEDGEEMQDYRDEEGGVEACRRSEGSDKQEEDDDDETGGSNTSGDNSSVEGSDGGHSESGATGGEEEGEEKDGELRDGEGKEGEAGEETGLLVTLSQISGSAIWSGESGDPTDINVTAL